MKRKSRIGSRYVRMRGIRGGVGVEVHIIASTWVEMARLMRLERGIAGGWGGTVIRRKER
jgi:hypothetical protein